MKLAEIKAKLAEHKADGLNPGAIEWSHLSMLYNAIKKRVTPAKLINLSVEQLEELLKVLEGFE